ncbi:hypothetical protein LX64_00738 [Chitinophaga skermanii]|uniref:Uncharacterized protein n=1 Tax=Chitinophaga skermanii TaxID=331697 RepID=A0A327R340_9BACT|nr:hypothetical protein [Chitinophaga skermanii]RAJ11130.1 hypothetical protein LX64_00738 [Chitinophaga skermanii]
MTAKNYDLLMAALVRQKEAILSSQEAMQRIYDEYKLGEIFTEKLQANNKTRKKISSKSKQ